MIYSLYDGHGNMVQTLERNGTSFSLNDQRAYDAWGGIRNTDASGDPKGRYCANLGHKADDESGLIYMRARYYEPGSGRFVSEDSNRQWVNWFAYAASSPLNGIDRSGRSAYENPTETLDDIFKAFLYALYAFRACQAGITPAYIARQIISNAITKLNGIARICGLVGEMDSEQAIVDGEQAEMFGGEAGAELGQEMIDAGEGINATFGTARVVAEIDIGQLQDLLALIN